MLLYQNVNWFFLCCRVGVETPLRFNRYVLLNMCPQLVFSYFDPILFNPIQKREEIFQKFHPSKLNTKIRQQNTPNRPI